MFFIRRLVCSAVATAAFIANPALAAQEFYAGDPVLSNGMEIVPHYLTGIEMETMKGMKMGPDEIHLEADIHAAKDEKHGFAAGAWIPYLTVSYTLEKVGGDMQKTGSLLPMTAGDGPHYANNVTVAGAGEYRLTYRIDPPSKAGFLRHVDKETGVPVWWEPITLSWTFTYPSKTKE